MDRLISCGITVTITRRSGTIIRPISGGIMATLDTMNGAPNSPCAVPRTQGTLGALATTGAKPVTLLNLPLEKLRPLTGGAFS